MKAFRYHKGVLVTPKVSSFATLRYIRTDIASVHAIQSFKGLIPSQLVLQWIEQKTNNYSLWHCFEQKFIITIVLVPKIRLSFIDRKFR